jgi:hypothetical protein
MTRQWRHTATQCPCDNGGFRELNSRALKTNEASMPRYFFNLNDGRKLIPDPDGTELPDDQAARAYAFRVMRELARNREERTSAWRLIVCEEHGTPCFELAFAQAEESVYRYPARCA